MAKLKRCLDKNNSEFLTIKINGLPNDDRFLRIFRLVTILDVYVGGDNIPPANQWHEVWRFLARLQRDVDNLLNERADLAEHVVKFSWTSDKRPPEADHLGLAREKGGKGVAGSLDYHRISSIGELRHGPHAR